MEVPAHVEGTTLLPILKDPAIPSGRAVVSTHGFRNHAVSGDRYRYIRYSDGSEELYDIESDPNEWRNLASDPSHRAGKEELAQWLPKHDEPGVGDNRQ